MRQQISKPTNPFAAIDLLLGVEKEPVGDEWFSTAQYMAHSGLTKSAARAALEKLFKNGKLERWQGKCSTTLRRVSKFRIKAANPPRSNKRQ